MLVKGATEYYTARNQGQAGWATTWEMGASLRPRMKSISTKWKLLEAAQLPVDKYTYNSL